MDKYTRQLQILLREKRIGYRKEFIREILKGVGVCENEVRLTYRLPMTVRTPLSKGKTPADRGVLYTVSIWWRQWDSVKNHFYTSRSIYRKIAYRWLSI